MKTSDFDFFLPEELIAQTPADRRDASRLLVIRRNGGSPPQLTHARFDGLPAYLRAGDCLVLNDSRVVPARLTGRRESGGTVEVLLLRHTDGDAMSWECLVKPGRKARTGEQLSFPDSGGCVALTGEITGMLDDGVRLIRLECRGPLMQTLERLGEMPLPPYIHEKPDDSSRYQTVYANQYGSAAAPTAGLHFTHELLDSIRAMGVEVCFVTLHVGLGTFRPVKSEDVEGHIMHTEYYDIPPETANAVNRAKTAGGRVIAVGTTVCRTLESASCSEGVKSGPDSTNIFITPGYTFKAVDALITNFHLPRSTLIMLVSALLGRENTLKAYAEAVNERYRFFSFGDCCLIV